MKNNQLVIAAVTLIVGAGSGFLGGMQYQKSQLTAGLNSNRLAIRGTGDAKQLGNLPNGTGNSKNGQVMFRGGAVTGEVTAMDDKSLTVKTTDGGSKIVYFSDTTIYRLSTETKKSDITVGKAIAVIGSTNSDGSTTAVSIEINPLQKMLNQQ